MRKTLWNILSIGIGCCLLLLIMPGAHAAQKKTTTAVTFSINGIQGAAQKNIEARLNSLLEPIVYGSNKAKVLFFYHQAATQIKSSIEPFGYFKSKVISSIQHQESHWHMQFNITPGPVMLVSKLKLQLSGPGANTQPFLRYKKHFPIHAGKPLNVTQYNKAKDNFLELAYRLGYFKAKIIREKLRINLKQYRATIIMHLDTGTRYHFGVTRFNPSPYSMSFLRRYMNYHPGEPYNSNSVQRLQNDLSNTPYFTQVIVDPTPTVNPPPYSVPIEIKTTAANSQHYMLSGGFGTDTGVRAVASADWLRVTRSGQRLNLNTNLSLRNSYLVGNYIIPGRQPAINYYTITSGIYHFDLENVGHADSAKIGISYDTKLWGWRQTIGLAYLMEKYDFSKSKSPNISPQLRQAQKTSMLIPSANWTRRVVKGRSIPKQGYMLSLQIAGAHKDVLAKDSFFQTRASIRTLYTLPIHLRAILRGEIGYTHINELSELPLSLQLLTGGANSLRGYGYQSIGPGKKMLLASAELQQRLFGNLYVVGFYDVGNVADSWKTQVKQSAGTGLAYLTSIGTFEITAAKPLRDSHKKWRIQFSMAPSI